MMTSKWLLIVLVFFCGCHRESQNRIPELLSHRSLGLGYLEENRWDDAANEFNKIIELAPEEPLGYANLALTELRVNKVAEAEEQINKALQRSKAPEIRLIHAEILDRKGDMNAAIRELETSTNETPWHVQSQYKLVELYKRSNNPENRLKIEKHLQKIVENDPANLPSRLDYVESLLRNNQPVVAVEQLREIRKQIPDLPADSVPYLDRTFTFLQANKMSDALTSVIAFHNILKPTPLYRQGVVELSGPGGSAIGFPLLSFSKNFSIQAASHPLQNIQLKEASNVVVDGISLAFGDSPFAFLSGPNLLLKNEKGHFLPAGFQPAVKSVAAYFADYNSDGKSDLLLLSEGGGTLFENVGGVAFKKILEFSGFYEGALFADLDHDGDLDIYAFGEKGSVVYRNNGDATFTEVAAKMELNSPASSAAIGDFDEDGDIDVITDTSLFSNLRQGHFQNVSHLPQNSRGAIVAADFNNDGSLDIFMNGIYWNNGKGEFKKGALSIAAPDAIAVDFDNDGFLDLLIAGDKPRLYRNQGNRNFEDASSLLPQNLTNIRKVAVNDYDADGDQDLFLADASGKMHVFRNDGGNANRWINVSLVALTTGSGKNNRSGIGSKLEVMTGDLYQMRVVTEPVVHFGLGSHESADVLRVVWTNGVPQNHFHPQTNQTIIEKQVLKGSCAFLYTWDGEKFRFVTDVLWKSAIGMPLGIMQENTTYAFPNSTDEYLKIPTGALQPKDGFYTMQMTEELWESPYLDQVRLVAVDHPASTDIFVDEKFVVPPYPKFQIYTVDKKTSPLSATDEKGADVLPLIERQDDQYIAALTPVRYQGVMQMHDLVLDLGKHSTKDDLLLFLTGWLYPTDASINMAMTQSTSVKVVMPYLEVIDRNGQWKTAIPNISFPMGKDKTMILNLHGIFPTEDHHVRIRTNMEIYWDQIFFTVNRRSLEFRSTQIDPVSADLHYRGFSKMFRKNLLGPPWVEYSEVDRHPKWRDLEGDYTRYGDVLPLLKQSDDMYAIFNSGDEITLKFDANQIPALPKDWVRDFLIYCDGWLKDGDLNTAYGKTVELLPFHAMTRYPYGKDEAYPQDAAHQQYRKTYNTRKVVPDKFRKLQ